MKLLIVDDEKLTREGIRRSLDLEALSIDSVILADTASTVWRRRSGRNRTSCSRTCACRG